jgi:hypothetical protein
MDLSSLCNVGRRGCETSADVKELNRAGMGEGVEIDASLAYFFFLEGCGQDGDGARGECGREFGESGRDDGEDDVGCGEGLDDWWEGTDVDLCVERWMGLWLEVCGVDERLEMEG